MPDLSFDRVVAFARDLIRIPSPPGGEAEVAERVRREFEALGFDDVWTDEVGNVVGRIAGRGESPAVMLCSHLDAVDVGDPAAWEYPPFEGVVADGFLHGRGAMDIKGPLAIQLYAAAHFVENRPAGDVLVACTVFEERGGWGVSHLLESGRLRPAAVIIGEATAGDVCIGHRGRAELVVDVHGVAGHASAPDRARSPLGALATLIPALEEFAAGLGSDPVLGRATLAPTRVETFPRSNNVIPDLLRVTVDWRVLPGTTAETAVRDLETFLRPRVRLPDDVSFEVRLATEAQRTYTGLEREHRLFTPGFLVSPEHPIAVAAAAAVERSTGRRPAIRPWTLATDGGRICGVHGIPAIGFAPGEERFAHTNRERLELESARAVYEAYPTVVRAVQEVVGRE